ncbi:MAG TPA: HAD-IA family hydrolase [Gemmatimonas sp.]|nr:HAD-IA family hydrolase [Gemmatimonas sp.]
MTAHPGRMALLFDLDGTLIDSIELLLSCMEHAFVGRSPAPSRAEWTAGIGTPLRTQLAEWCDGEVAVEELVQKYRDFQDQHLERLTAAYPGVLEFFDWARGEGHATALVTSKGRGMTARSLEHVGLAGSFDVVVTYEDTDRHKPGPEPVRFALDRLGMPASRAIFLGDSTHDMYAGRAAGVRTAAALWGPFSREELLPAEPTWWLHSMSELRGIVESALAPAVSPAL